MFKFEVLHQWFVNIYAYLLGHMPLCLSADPINSLARLEKTFPSVRAIFSNFFSEWIGAQRAAAAKKLYTPAAAPTWIYFLWNWDRPAMVF
jgi:hypothetical protein